MIRTVGVLGGGQLGRMLALAGYPLGLRFHFFDPDPRAPAAHMAMHICAAYSDVDALTRFAESVDVITYEFENVPVDVALGLIEHRPVCPPPRALLESQDRLTEKTFLRSVGIPTADFVSINCSSDLEAHEIVACLPGILKTRRMGYDGKGQAVVKSLEELKATVSAMGAVDLILEAFVSFTAEYSLIGVRSASGESRFYPLVENVHRGGILRKSTLPISDVDGRLQKKAEAYSHKLMDALEYVGVLTIEFFFANGDLIANEIAPRVHNSGHWSIEGAETSQFENHLRAVCGLPLGSTRVTGYVGMLNIIGDMPDIPRTLAQPGAHLHLYGKEPRSGRKIGHITVCKPTAEERNNIVDAIQNAENIQI